MIMPVQIELPERLIDALENRARQLHSSIQEVAERRRQPSTSAAQEFICR
jgi:hypothetical protein